jgi:GTP-binding protein LepA
MATGAVYNETTWACSRPKREPRDALEAGEVGFIIAGIKELQAAKVGDTVTLERSCPTTPARPASRCRASRRSSRRSLPACTPTEASEYDQLRDALEKLKLNDSSLRYEPEVSQALGFGFRCGFLGLLHMEIVQERLEREFDQDLITTAPSVVYEVS